MVIFISEVIMSVSIAGTRPGCQRLIETLNLQAEQRNLNLICQDNSVVKCHLVILTLHSRLVKSLYSDQSSCCLTDLSLQLAGFERKVVVTLISFLYTGECRVEDSQTLTNLNKLRLALGLDIEMTPQPREESQPSLILSDTTANAMEAAKESRKRITMDIMKAIEEIKSGVTNVLCTECDHILTKENFLLHYRSHMQSYSKIIDELERSTSISGSTEASIKEDAEAVIRVKSATNQRSIPLKSGSLEKVEKTSNKEIDDTDERGKNVVECSESCIEPVADFDPEEYEKLLRGHIHSSILRRKRNELKGSKGLILVSQQEVEDEMQRESRIDIEKYARLKVQKIVKYLYEKKRRFGIGASVISDEEIQEVIDKENTLRKVKLVIDIKRARDKNRSSS